MPRVLAFFAITFFLFTSQAAASITFTDGLLSIGPFQKARVLPAPSKISSGAAIPDGWDIIDSVLATNSNPFENNVCLSPNALIGGGANPLYPCKGNPPSATIRGNIEQSSFSEVLPSFSSAPWPETFNSDIRFPAMALENPDSKASVPIAFVASGPVLSSYNNGSLKLTPAAGSAFEIRALVGLSIPAAPQMFTYCKVPLPGMSLSTDSATPFTGTPFSSDLKGAIQGRYNVTAPSTPVTQANLDSSQTAAASEALSYCSTVSQVFTGNMAIWFGNGVPVPACPEEGVYPNCYAPSPSGGIISQLALKGKGSIKKGKSAKLTLLATNPGDTAKSATVSLFSKHLRVPKTIKVTAPAKSVGRKVFRVKAKKKKGQAMLLAKFQNLEAKKYLRIKG